MSRFGAKLSAREQRKKEAMAKNANRLNNHQQLEFQFDSSSSGEETIPPPPQPEAEPVFLPDTLEYHLPPLSLFKIQDQPNTFDQDEITENTKKIQNCIDNFSVDAEVGDAIRGPRVTMYKIHTAKGVRVSIISTYTNDLAMALSARSLRIIAPVPGHDYVGIEVPNRHPDAVLCGNILNGKNWADSQAKLPLIMGKNIEGTEVILDLAKAPHLLVAGATGSGKSVCLNSFIVSLIMKYSPDDLKLILVDPKVVEMNTYNRLPHLIVPVINDVQLVVIALRWLITEMGRRYRLLAKAQVRNLEDYNKRPHTEQPVLDEDGSPIPDKLPFIVLIIDELADIMMTERTDVENSLARLAQMSRAVGIHTIIATQRPSVDVITGVIKANFPTRIAFQTSSQIDSRTIIDGKGAESLLGKGDMLFKPPTSIGLQRIQGAMVTDEEINALVETCAAQRQAPLDFDLIKTSSQAPEELETPGEDDGDVDNDNDSLIHAAMEVVINDQKASISYIQRRLKIGYNKAATLIEILEKRGIVGPQIGSLKREVLVDSMEQALEDDNY